MSNENNYWEKVYEQAEPKPLKFLHADGTIDEDSGAGGSYDDTELRNRITQAEDNIGNLANLETTVKTDVVSAINEVVSKVQSRPIVTVKTYVSDDSKSILTPSDVVNAGFSLPVGSYLVTVYRDTSSSLTYFIGWVWSTDTFDDSNFHKIAGEGTSLIILGDNLIYNGGDSGTNLETTWIFQPIGDSHVDN